MMKMKLPDLAQNKGEEAKKNRFRKKCLLLRDLESDDPYA
jgi:hypothetical protein